jgi:integrase
MGPVVGRKGGRHNRPGVGNVQRLVDRRGYVSFRGRVTRDGRTYYAPAAGAGIPDRFSRRAWQIAERQARDAARAALDELIRDLDRDRLVEADKRRATLGDWLSVWTALRRDAMPADTPSWEAYARAVALHVEPFLGGVRLAQLGPAAILRWRRELAEHPTKPRSGNTIRYAERVLRTALREAKVQGYPVVEGVLVMRKMAEPERGPPPSLSPAQFARLLRVSPEPRRTFYLTAYHAACRFGEARGLQWGRVLATSSQLDLSWQLDPRNRLRRPKMGSAGLVDVPQVLLEALEAHRRRQEHALGRPVAPEDFVFLDAAGRGVRPWAWWRRHLRDDLAAAGLPDHGLHAFRHGAGWAMAEVEPNPLRIQERMRHRDLKTTQRYLRPVPGAGQETARRVAERVERAESG